MGRRGFGLLLLASLPLLAACASPPPPPAPAALPVPPVAVPTPPPPKTVVVLLADADGKVGRVNVANAAGNSELDEEREATKVGAARSAPTAPAPMSPEEIAATFGAALAAQPAPPLHFTLYFEQNSTELTAGSRREFPAVVAAVRDRASVDTSVVGHSDTAGDATKNLELSLRRAMAVGALLAAEGIAPGSLDITSHGEANPLVPTADNVAEPKNRRVEVTVR